jgi:hypothetical protein
MEIVTNIRKMAHVPIQVWKGWDTKSLFSGWSSALGGFKTLIGVMDRGSIFGVTLPGSLCIVSSRTIMEATIERKTAAHIMML